MSHKHCVFCGEELPIPRSTAWRDVCESPFNTTTPDTVGNRHHAFFIGRVKDHPRQGEQSPLRSEMKTGVELIADERSRQVAEEGWTPEHDDEHTAGCLARAGAVYAAHGGAGLFVGNEKGTSGDVIAAQRYVREGWPWDSEWWKPADNPIRNLVKAGALIAAEIDRLQRKR